MKKTPIICMHGIANELFKLINVDLEEGGKERTPLFDTNSTPNVL